MKSLLTVLAISLSCSFAFAAPLSKSNSNDLVSGIKKTFKIEPSKEGKLAFSSLMCFEIPMYGASCTIGTADGQIIQTLGGSAAKSLYATVNKISAAVCEAGVICAEGLSSTVCTRIKKGIFSDTYSCEMKTNKD